MAIVFYLGVILLTLLLCKLLHGWIFRREKCMDISGPKGWPIVGNSLQMDPTYPHKTLSEWSKEYGDIFKINIFQDNVIVLNDYESIQQMLNSEECSSRPYIFRMLEISHKGFKDVAFRNFSPEWNEKKKLLTRSLNAFGEGLKKIESVTLESIDKLFNDIKDNTNNFRESIDMKSYINKCTAGIITTLFYGRKLTETELTELLDSERKLMKLASPAGLIAILDQFHWMRHLPIKYIQEPIKDAKIFRQWIIKMQTDKANEQVKGEECILDSLMTYVNKVTNKLPTPEEVAGMTHNIISGGFVTTTAILYSLIIVLINFPEIQEKMYEEIQSVTKGVRPKVSDRSCMTYVQAVMEEIFRYSSILPLAVPHYASEDTVIRNKHIPKGTTFLTNFWKLHHDDRYFDEPWKFKPERYLDGRGEMAARDDAVWKHSLPFSAGRRICPGEGLARNRTFLIIASLLQKFRFLPEDEHDIPSCDPRLYDSGLVVLPFKYKVKIAQR